MAMRYANSTDVLAHLEIAAGDTATVAAVERVENALAALFDDEVGRTWGTAAVAETREVTLGTYPATVGYPTRLVTSTGIRTVTAIETGGTWDGSAWADGDALAATDYRLTLLDQDGLYWGIDHLAGAWSGTVRVTATWGDQPEATVPADVATALTLLTIKAYRRMTSSPQEVVGPDGLMVVTPDGWKDDTVQRAIRHHRAVRLLV